jgi:hypothetical protein
MVWFYSHGNIVQVIQREGKFVLAESNSKGEKMLKEKTLIILWIVGTIRAFAFTPGNALPENSINDFSASEEIVLGRIIKIERKKSDNIRIKASIHFKIYATLIIGETYKGHLKAGEEISILIGEYLQKEENNSVPEFLSLFNGLSPLNLTINDIFLIFLVKDPFERKGHWIPRSLNNSIFKIIKLPDTNSRFVETKKNKNIEFEKFLFLKREKKDLEND